MQGIILRLFAQASDRNEPRLSKNALASAFRAERMVLRRRQTFFEPHQRDIAPGLLLDPRARRDAVEIAVGLEL